MKFATSLRATVTRISLLLALVLAFGVSFGPARAFAYTDAVIHTSSDWVAPWTGALLRMKSDGTSTACSTVIVDPNVVLTAAHCLASTDVHREAWAGPQGHQQKVLVQSYTTPDVNTDGIPGPANDIAVMYLKTALQFNRWVQPIYVARADQDNLHLRISGAKLVAASYDVLTNKQETSEREGASMREGAAAGMLANRSRATGGSTGELTDSGGPVYVASDYGPVLLGIQSKRFELAVDLTNAAVSKWLHRVMDGVKLYSGTDLQTGRKITPARRA